MRRRALVRCRKIRASPIARAKPLATKTIAPKRTLHPPPQPIGKILPGETVRPPQRFIHDKKPYMIYASFASAREALITVKALAKDGNSTIRRRATNGNVFVYWTGPLWTKTYDGKWAQVYSNSL